MEYEEGTCPHCHGQLKVVAYADWNNVCCQCGRCWIIINLLDKTYWLAGFDAAGEIWEIHFDEKELVPEYNPLWNKLWDKYRERKK